MTTMTLRGIDETLSHVLKNLAESQGVSLNSLVLRLVREATGVDKQRRTAKYHDLDSLAGTWNEEDENAFLVSTRAFERIDEDMWQ